MEMCSMGLVTIFPVQLLIGLNLMAEHQPMPPVFLDLAALSKIRSEFGHDR
jgi:hypothetical protein